MCRKCNCKENVLKYLPLKVIRGQNNIYLTFKENII